MGGWEKRKRKTYPRVAPGLRCGGRGGRRGVGGRRRRRHDATEVICKGEKVGGWVDRREAGGWHAVLWVLYGWVGGWKEILWLVLSEIWVGGWVGGWDGLPPLVQVIERKASLVGLGFLVPDWRR